MKNPEKLNRKSASPPLRRPAPAPYFNLTFLFFRFPPSGGGNQNLLPPLKRVGRSQLCDVNDEILSRDSNYIVDMVMLAKFQFYKDLNRNRFFEG